MSLNPRPNQHDIFSQDSSQSHKRTSLDAPALDLGNIPTPPPTPLTPPTQNQNLAQSAQEHTPQIPITPPTNTQADTTGDNPPPQHTQKEIFANDVVSDESKPYPTSKMRKLSLNAQVINAINAENADEALDFLSTQESNIDWEQVAQARANGIKSHEILSQIASATATNPRAMWINIDTPLSKGELARAKFDYERSQISDDELKNLKEQTSLNQFKSLKFWLGLDDEKKRQASLTLAKFAESSQSYEDLPQEAKSLLNMQGKDSYSLNVRSIFSGKSEGELLYEQKQKQAKIYQKIKNKEHLSDDELDYIDSYGEGAGFGDNAEKQKQWLLKYEAQNIIPSYTQSMVFALENKSDYKALFFGSGKGKERDKEKFLQGLDGIAKVSGFDSASVDEKSGDIFFEKEGFAYQVNTRFLDNIDNMLKANAFSIGGSIAGSIAGAKALGKNPASLITGVVGGGALGAFVGGTLDGVLADLYTNNQINFAENLRHGLHEGIFNIAGDALVGGAIKGGKVLAKAGKNFTPQGLKDTLASTAQSAKNLTNKIMEYSIVGQAAKNVFDGNVSAVRSFLRQIPKEERESIKQGIKDFGLELELNSKSNQALNNFISKHGQSHPHLANTAQKIYDIFTLPAGKELQQELLSSIRADNTGALLGFLSEAANSSPALQKSLHSILNQTHARAINHLKSFGLKQNDIAQVFEAYQKGTKEAYAKALDMIQEVFKSEKTQVSRKQYDSLVSELKASALDEKELNYLKTLESKIYGNGENGSPRSFENLKDALSLLNEKWGKHAKNMNFTAEKLRRVEKQMREDIKQGINAIFDGSSQGASFRELFESALSDYGNMKGILKAVDKLKLRDTSIAYQKTLDKMLDFLIAGEKGEFSNLAKLTEHLPKEQKIKFELATLNALLEKSIFSAKNGQEKVLEVFNSGEFLARLESIAGEFSTPQAREYIDFVKEFHNLFKNDYAISKATLEPALTQKMGGGIATTPTGRFEYQRAKLIYDSIIRLMPHIPFMSNFNEKISGAAVRYHLKSALRKSHSVSELKRTLSVKLASGKFDSPTSKVIAQMLDGVESSQEQIIKELNANGGSDIGGNTGGKVDNAETLANNGQQPIQTLDNEIISQKGLIQEASPKQALETLSHTPATQMPEKITIDEFMQSLDEVGNKANFIEHLLSKGDAEQRIAMLNLVEPTLKSPDIVAQIVENGAKKQKHIKKFSDGKEFFYLLASKENGSVLLTGFKTNRLNTIEKELENADIIQTFIRQGSKQEPSSRFGLPNERIISQSNTNTPNTTKNNQIKQDIFTLAKQEKQAKEQAELAKKQADSEFIAQREAQKQARLDKLLAAQRDSQGSTTLEARAKIKAEQMGEDIPYTRLSDTHIILDDITYPAEFVMIDKKDLKPSFEAGGFQTREVKQESKIAQIRDNFEPLKIFGKVGEYDGLPLIARNGEIIAGNHRGEAIKNLSGENLARYNEYAKKVFGIDLPQDKIIVRRILDDTQSPQGANLLEQMALAARSNKGAESTLGEQATSALGTYKDKIQKELLDNPARRYIESDSVDNQMQTVANLLNAPLKAEEANLGLLASLSKASYNLDIAKALDMIEGDDLLKAKIKNMLIANAGGFYNISRSIATPKLNEITNYLVDAIAYLGKASKQSGAENINRSEAYRELAQKINDRASGKVRSFDEMETPLDEFVAQAKADVLGASLSKFANQDHASQRLYEALRDMPSILEEKFSTPSFDFFGNGGNKALKEVDMYDFLDYMIGRGQQNEATSQLKDALLELKKLESSAPPNNTPPNPPSPNNTKPSANNPTPSAKSSLDKNAPSKTTLQKDLSAQEIKETVQKWDLDNPNPNDKLLVSLVQGDELATLSKEFDFKGNYALAREIDAEHIHHALQRHSNLDIETSRNQIPITKDDIFNYQNIIKTADTREVKGDKIIYKKQVNGHYVVVEEALTGKNKINFVTMYKPKGNIMPPSTPAKNSHDLDRTLSGGYNKPNSTTPNPKSQITSDDLEALDELKTFFQKQQKESIDDIAQLKATLKKQQEFLRKNISKFMKKRDPKKLQLEAEVRNTRAKLTKAYSEKAYFKAQEKELKSIESTLKEYQTNIDSFSQNPSVKNLTPLHKIKKKLYATLEATQYQVAGSTPDNLNRTLNEALETTLEAISQSRKAIALKKTNKSTPNPVQEFREFITATRNDIDYVLGNFDKDTALKVLDEKLANTTNKNQKRFLSRLKSEVDSISKIPPPNLPNPSNFTPPNTNTHAGNAITPPANADGHAQISPSSAQAVSKTPPPTAQADKGGELFDLPSQTSQAQKANPTQNQINKDEVLQNLQHLPSTPLPKEVSEAEFLEQGLEKVVNKSSFLAHQKTKSDAHTRLKYLNLIKPTLENKDITLKTLGKNGEDRKAYLKVFEYGNGSDKKLFYTLITEQDDSYLITGYPINKIKEVERVIKNAQSVEYFGRPTEALGTATEKNASSLSEIIPNSTPKTQDPRGLRLKELESSLDYRFENKFRKQAEQELGKDLDIDKIDNALMSKTITSNEHSRITKEINSDYAKWFDTQRAKGNKEILEYDKDLAEYRKLHNDFYKEQIEAKNKAENKQAHLQWLDSYKHQMIGKTDEEIIAAEIKKPKSTSKGKKEYFTYDESKALLETTRKRLEKAFDLHPLSEFGTNYAEFYQDGKGAIAKLIAEANAAKQAGQDFSGQVAGAFSKEIDGAEASIDLVWGKITNAQTHEGYGLAHIIDKHPELDLSLIPQIIERGKVLDDKGVKTILLKRDNETYRVGLSRGFKGRGENLWVITSYKVDKSPRPDSLPSSEVTKSDGANLHSSDLSNDIITNPT